MKNKTLILATGLFPEKIGGPSSYSRLLIRDLPKYGYNIKVEDFCKLLKYPKIIRHIIYFLKLLKRSIGGDVIYALDPVSVGFPTAVVSIILRKKFFLKIEGDYAFEHGRQQANVLDTLEKFSTENNNYSFSVRLLKKIELWVAKRANAIIVPNSYLKRIVINWGVNPEKIKVSPNSFIKPTVTLSKEIIRQKLGFDTPVVISAGRLVPWNGFDTLVSLMPLVREKIKDAQLVILGNGPDKAYLQSRIQTLGVENFVKIIDVQTEIKFFEYIKASSVFVLNTSHEPFAHQLLSVLALETPVVTTVSGGAEEIIEDNTNGIIISYNNKEDIVSAITNIVSDGEKAKKLSFEGAKKLDDFGEKAVVESLVKILD